MAYQANVNSAVMHVSDIARSVTFYRDFLGCTTQVATEEAAILLTGAGFQLYLLAISHRGGNPTQVLGLEFLEWSCDTRRGLDEFAAVLRNGRCYSDTRVVDDVTFVEGTDPDGLRIVMAFPPPQTHPRKQIDVRFYA